MKNTFLRIAGLLGLALLAATQTVRAQEPLLVNIPFAFTAGQMTLPAGEYRVQDLRAGSTVLLIQRTDRSAATLVTSFATSANRRRDQTKLIFHRYGNHYFLAQVWIEGSSRGREIPKSAKEKEQALVTDNTTPDQVTIVARLIPPKR